MFTGEGNFERGRREANEGRDAIERRARIEAEAASAVRNRLEKGSPSSARRDFAGMLNAMVADAAGREMPGLAALEAIRKGQRHRAIEPEFLLDVARALIEAVRARRRD